MTTFTVIPRYHPIVSAHLKFHIKSKGLFYLFIYICFFNLKNILFIYI